VSGVSKRNEEKSPKLLYRSGEKTATFTVRGRLRGASETNRSVERTGKEDKALLGLPKATKEIQERQAHKRHSCCSTRSK